MPDTQNPESNKADDHSFWHGWEVSDSSPVEVSVRVFNESEQVFEASLFIGFVNTLSAESVLFEFPIILFSNRSLDKKS